METAKKRTPPRFLPVALALMLAFWGFSGGSALASPEEQTPGYRGETTANTASSEPAGESVSSDAAANGEQATKTGQEAPDDAMKDDASSGENPDSNGTATADDDPGQNDGTPESDPLGSGGQARALAPLSAGETQRENAAETRAAPIPVTNETELQDAMWDIPISTAGIIELQNSFAIVNAVDVPRNRDITLTSTEGNTFTITQTRANERHFEIDGTGTYDIPFTLENVVLDGNGTGGGVLVDGRRATLNLKAGATIQNCSSNVAGGAVRVNRGVLNIEGGTVQNNKSTLSDRSVGGGGIYATDGSLTMSSGLIDGNTAGNGGGVNLVSKSTFTMTGGTISSNKSTVNQGGGVLVAGGSSFTMSGTSLIEKNESDRGAGVNVLQDESSFTMNDGTIRANVARIHGGGVLVNGKGTFTMNSGVIGGDNPADGNTAESGGGVCLYADWSGRDITFIMAGDSLIKNNTADQGGGLNRYNTASATIEMRDTATITENSADVGGGVYMSGGTKTTFDMYGESTIHHNTATRTGGGIDSISVELTMHEKSSVHHNTAGGWGGGLAVWSNELFTMNDESSVHHNESTASSGGGISVSNRAGMVMNDQAVVSDNTAAEDGGGIFLEFSASSAANPTNFTMTGGTITRNTALGATKGGGGIMFGAMADRSVTLDIGGDSVIVDNSAPNGHGGGIYCNEPYWGQMVVGEDTVFDRNTASVACIPPTTVFSDYPAIEFASISIGGLVPYHPLNNYDINFTGGTPTSVYRVTYHGNGHTAGDPHPSAQYAEGANVTVLDENTLARDGYDFLGWHTDPTAAEALHAPAGSFSMPAADVDLHAIWKAKDPGNPTDPTDPTDPGDPTDPTDPTDPKDPTDPVDPGKPADPNRPGKPAPTKPTNPAKLAKTGDDLALAPALACAAFASILAGAGAYAIRKRRGTR